MTRTVKMKLFAIGIFLFALTAMEAESAGLSQDKLIEITHSYLLAREASMAENATAKDIEKALMFCTDDVVYEHVEFQAKVEGKENIRQGMLSHLGETKDPKFEILKNISGYNMVVVELTESFKVKKDKNWEPLSRRRVKFFEFQGDKIRRMVDY